jgi:HEAT repeat protein
MTTSDSWVKKQIMEELGDIDDERAVLALKEALKDEDAYVREWAAVALGSEWAASAVEDLVEALSDASDDVRQNAAGALGAIGAPEATRPLCEVARADGFIMARVAAAHSLGEIGGLAAWSCLVDLLRDDEQDGMLQRTAADLLAKNPPSELSDELWKIATDPRQADDIRGTLLRGLSNAGDARATKLLADPSRMDPD